MAIIYRGAGAWGAGKGSNLTAAEVDNNFWELHGRVDTLETTPPVPEQIDEISLVGSQLTITLTDSTVFGPFTIPRARFNWRGEWAPSTIYFDNDVVSVAGDGIYLVEEPHTSAAVFDPDADLASGGANPTYALMFAWDVWGGSGQSGSGLSGHHMPYHGGVFSIPDAVINPNLTHAGGYIRANSNAGGAEFALPADATVNFPIGNRFWVRDISTGSGSGLVITAPSAVELEGPAGTTFTVTEFGGVVDIIKVAANKWEVWGDLD